MKRSFTFSAIIFASLFLLSYQPATACIGTTVSENHVQLSDKVVTRDDQSALSPQFVLEDLTKGNERFIANELIPRDYPSQVSQTASGQYPKAIILSCVDSRVPVETVFDQGVGDVFVARVAGNFVNEDILGSMEFACQVAGSKLIVVMGHESCGAVMAAIDDVELGNITSMLQKIKPAVTNTQSYKGEKTSRNAEYVTLVSRENVINTMVEIRMNSPILKDMEAMGEIDIVGAVYNMETGKVDFFTH